MPPLREVLLAPFFKDVDDYDFKVVELERDVTCGDILEAVARELGLRRKGLALMGSKAGAPTRFHTTEAPVAFMQVRGLESLEDLPSPLKVRSKKRTELTLEEAMKIQEELIDAYSTEVFVLMMMEAKKRCKRMWRREGRVVPKDYNNLIKGPLEMAQETVLPKWGYDATAQGMLQMQFHYAPWDPLPQVQNNVRIIERKTGLDFEWADEDDYDEDEEEGAPRERNFGPGGKLKMLYLYGGGANSALAKMQCANIFKDSPMYSKLEFTVFEAPHEAHVTWHPNPIMQQQIRPFGETIYLYYERVPYPNSQREEWVGIEDSLRALRDHLRRRGPYDGLVGFDMGGELVLQAARLQQEGDPGFQGMFRFLVLFTASTARQLSNCARPSAPLRIPAVLSWAMNDESHPYTMFEESALFFPQEMREIILHSFGHMPPRWGRASSPEPLERLTRFLSAMWEGAPWAPSAHPDNAWAEGLALPLERRPPGAAAGGTPRRLLVVHDPMGAHGYAATLSFIEEYVRSGRAPPPASAVLYVQQGVSDFAAATRAELEACSLSHEHFRTAAGEGLAVEGVEYTEEQRSYGWHPSEFAFGNVVKAEDVVLRDEDEAAARAAAEGMLRRAELAEGERVGVVGLGTGAFIAFALARLLVAEARARPIGLWLVNPPTRLPAASTRQGALAACPVRVVVHEASIVGPPWCYETATDGPYAHSTYGQTAEMVQLVVQEFASLCGEAERKAEERDAAARARREAEEQARARREEEEARARRREEEEARARQAEEARRREEERARAEAQERARRTAEERQEREAAEAAARLEREAAAQAAAQAAEVAGNAAAEERCRQALAQSPRPWAPVTMEQLQANHSKAAPGLLYGLGFPWSAELLERMGPAWLTEAFHAAGTLPDDNRVTGLRDVKEFVGGGACSKLVFEVEYEKPSEDLHTKLFAKIPYPLSGKTLSDRMSSSIMQQGAELYEINAYRLLESRFPFRVPKYYFGDISNETTNWILITECVQFGGRQGGVVVDPAYDKMKDWELKGPVDEYYYLLVRLGARVAGMYKAGTLAPLDVLHRFYDSGVRERHLWGVRAESSGIGEVELKAKLRMGGDFIETTGKALFPAACTSPEFLVAWKRLLAGVNAYTAEIAWWCNRDPAYIAWSHGNMNVDNVWFWRDEDHVLHAGVLDWGGAACASVGVKLWWWLYCCEYDFLNEELDGLLRCFIDEYHGHGGPRLDEEELAWQFKLSALNQGAQLLGTVPQIYRMCPKKQWPTVKDRKDPRISANIDGKNTLRIYVGLFVSICSMIKDWDLAASFNSWVDEVTAAAGIPKKAVAVT